MYHGDFSTPCDLCLNVSQEATRRQIKYCKRPLQSSIRTFTNLVIGQPVVSLLQSEEPRTKFRSQAPQMTQTPSTSRRLMRSNLYRDAINPTETHICSWKS